jgi:hypothetical protein
MALINEVKPSIDVVKKIVGLPGTTVGYLLDETGHENVLKDLELLHYKTQNPAIEPGFVICYKIATDLSKFALKIAVLFIIS